MACELKEKRELVSYDVKADYEYNTLMCLLGVSVSKHLLDEHFTLVWANEFYYKLIGWSKEEYEDVFRNQPDLYYQKDPEEWEQLTETVLGAVAAGESGYRLLSRIRQKDDNFVWVQFSTEFADEYINGYQVAYSVLTNVDDLIRMQKEQSVTYENLPGFVAKYRVDQELKLTLLEGNSRFMDYFGKGPGEEGNAPERANIEDSMGILLEQKDKLLSGQPVHFVMEAQSRTGQQMWLNVNASCIDWQNGCPVYLAIIIDITDVTELRRMQEKLTEQAKALEDALIVAENANRAKTDFLSRMSHEIRTPMNAIIGMTTIAAAYIEDRKRVEDCLEKIGYSSKHLMMLINDILDMSKIDAGKMKIACDRFDLEQVAESITSIIYPQAVDRGLTFTLPLVGITTTVLKGDSLRLNQILINLLSNALKFTPKGGSIRLEIRQLRRNNNRIRLRFTVSDTGIGMKKEFLERLFTPFEQENQQTGQQLRGTGLGMAIAGNLITLMGGTISVKSRLNEGTVFTVELDFDIPEDAEKTNIPKQPAMKSLKILIADGDRDCCMHGALLLENLGIHSDWSETGANAIKKIQEAYRQGGDYDVCLIDWRLIDMDGIEATRRIRQLPGTEKLIIILTAYDWGALEQRGREAGANAFLAKPIFASSLYDTLISVTGIRRAVPLSQSKTEEHRLRLEGYHVLLVEDNELNREIAMELLQMAGLVVHIAKNGREAVDLFLAGKDRYDLILMDVQMPVMDGYQATEEIRKSAHPRGEIIPIIAMTADAFQEDVTRAYNAGMNGHIAKPIDQEILYRVLSRELEGKTEAGVSASI